MPSNKNSQCQLFQLHIDAYLDNELEAARVDELQAHLRQCQACSQEMAYAERLHRAVVSLPVLEPSAQTFEPVDRLFGVSSEAGIHQQNRGFWSGLGALIDTLPAPLRVGVPAAAVLLLALGLGRELTSPAMGGGGQELADQTSASPQAEYSAAEIRAAMEDLELALDYLGQISERTEVMIQDRFLLRPLEESMNASFDTEAESTSDDRAVNGPI